GVALDAGGFGVELLEGLLGDRAVVPLELLLGAELQAVVRGLALAALAVLARAIGAGVERRGRTAPDVFAKTAVDLVLGLNALRHRNPFRTSKVIAPSSAPPCEGADRFHGFRESRVRSTGQQPGKWGSPRGKPPKSQAIGELAVATPRAGPAAAPRAAWERRCSRSVRRPSS